MVMSTFGLRADSLESVVYTRWKEGRLVEARGWMQGLCFLFGGNGFLRVPGGDYLAWYRGHFHPEQIDDRELTAYFSPLVTA